MKKNIRLLFVAAALFLSANQYVTAQESVEKGNEFYDYFQFKEAIKEYEFALKNNRTVKNEAHILKRLAYSYLYTFQYSKAETKFNELVRLGDKKAAPAVYLDYGNVLKIQGKYDKAKDQYAYYNTLVKSDSYSSFLTRSLNWAIKNQDSINKKVHVGVTNLDVSGQSLGYCFFDNGLIYAHAKDTNYNEFTTLFNLGFVTRVDSVTFTKGDDVVSDINFPFNEGSPSLSPDGETLYFTATGAKVKEGEIRKSGIKETSTDGVSNLRLYSSKLENGKFTGVYELPFNDKNFNYIHPTVSADGNTLYFASDMPGGYGGLDIYKVTRNADGTWTTPINLGEKVNTTEQEGFPFLVGDKLYFASKGHVGFGGYDIFVTTIGNNFTLSNPQNMGKPFNTSKDDMAFVLDKDGTTGYLSSNRDSDNGMDKVYFFNSNYTPAPVKTIMPKIDTAQATLAKVENNLKKDAAAVANTPKTVLPKTDAIKDLAAKKETTVKKETANTVTIKIEEDKTVSNALNGKMVMVANGYFKFNSSNLPADLKAFNDVLSLWKVDKRATIEIIATTDCRGSEQYNLMLSRKRALAAERFFKLKGVPANKITAIGTGEEVTEQKCTECEKCTEEMHQENRKVQIILRK
jgi:outer membrane protein OmpA-like peptidoglycan-associated protein/tetratricopeptide (TPR) repeat protein